MKIRVSVSNDSTLRHEVHLSLWIQSKKLELHGIRIWQAFEVNDISKVGESVPSITRTYSDMSIVEESYISCVKECQAGSIFSLHTIDRVTRKVTPIARLECTAIDIQPVVINNELVKDADDRQIYYVRSVTLWVKKQYSKSLTFDPDESIHIGYEEEN